MAVPNKFSNEFGGYVKCAFNIHPSYTIVGDAYPGELGTSLGYAALPGSVCVC